ncbi:TPA: hypothetical protein ACPT4I_005206, partial [Klebsiella pneumoniae]
LTCFTIKVDHDTYSSLLFILPIRQTGRYDFGTYGVYRPVVLLHGDMLPLWSYGSYGGQASVNTVKIAAGVYRSVAGRLGFFRLS